MVWRSIDRSLQRSIEQAAPERGACLPLPAEVQDEARGLLQAEHWMDAIKLIRSATYYDLADAKDVAAALLAGVAVPADGPIALPRVSAKAKADSSRRGSGLGPIRWFLILLGITIAIGGYLMGTRYYGHPETERLGNLAFWAMFPGVMLAVCAAVIRLGAGNEPPPGT